MRPAAAGQVRPWAGSCVQRVSRVSVGIGVAERGPSWMYQSLGFPEIAPSRGRWGYGRAPRDDELRLPKLPGKSDLASERSWRRHGHRGDTGDTQGPLRVSAVVERWLPRHRKLVSITLTLLVQPDKAIRVLNAFLYPPPPALGGEDR